MTSAAETCPLCAQPVHIAAEQIPGYQRGTQFTIKECEGCGASFAYPLEVDDAVYAAIYENIRFIPGYNRYLQYAREIGHQKNPLRYLSRQEDSYWAAVRYLRTRTHRSRKLKVLEVGCGLGYFTYALARAGHDARGIDLSSRAVEWATQHFGPYYTTQSLQDLEAEKQCYDLIIMNQLIEHVPDVHPFFAEAVKLLAVDGGLLLTTPNKTSFPRRVWDTELPPVHLWWFTEDSMRCLAERHGCTVSFIDFTIYHRLYLRIRNPELESPEAKQFLDARGDPLTSVEIPPSSRAMVLLDRMGVSHPLRVLRSLIVGGNRWRGPRGEVMAVVFHRSVTTPS